MHDTIDPQQRCCRLAPDSVNILPCLAFVSPEFKLGDQNNAALGSSLVPLAANLQVDPGVDVLNG